MADQPIELHERTDHLRQLLNAPLVSFGDAFEIFAGDTKLGVIKDKGVSGGKLQIQLEPRENPTEIPPLPLTDLLVYWDPQDQGYVLSVSGKEVYFIARQYLSGY